MKSRQSDLLKLEAVKTITTPRKINTILLNIKINRPKLVKRVDIHWQQNGKILQKYTWLK